MNLEENNNPANETVTNDLSNEIAPVTDTVEAAPEVSVPVAETAIPVETAQETLLPEAPVTGNDTLVDTNDSTPEPVASAEPAAAELNGHEAGTPTAVDTAQADEPKNEFNPALEAVFNELKEKHQNNECFEVQVISRIKGGLRVMYNEMPLFLPAAHFGLKKIPSEQELNEAIGKSVSVSIIELQELGEGRRAVIVSRKNLLLDEFWTNINVGDKVSGKVSSIASFGIFLDLGGVEGLIHISRLSQTHVDNPSSIAKKGDVLEAVVVELDRNKNRIALSRKELEESPWKNAETEFPAGSRQKGIVRRLTDFGVYVELKPGVDGLLRTSELSWTKRVRKPSDMFSPGAEIDVEILAISSEKETLSLSYKKTIPNPWNELAEKYPVDSEFNGLVLQVLPQGAIIEVNEEIDGFMPRSKMKSVLKGKKIPYQAGERIDVKIADLVPGEESLILAPVESEEPTRHSEERERRPRPDRDSSKVKVSTPSITLIDMLTDKGKKDLFKSVE